jgi:Grx4 family monothiol glutaredoxin
MSKVVDVTGRVPAGQKAVLLFWAAWHEASVEGGPMDRVLAALAAVSSSSSSSSDDDDGDTAVLFGRVEAEKYPQVTSHYGVTAVPTFVLINETGKVIERIEGADDAAAVTTAVQRLLNAPPPGVGGSTIPAANEPPLSPEGALSLRLDRLIRSSPVMLFMKGIPAAPRCGFSRQAVEMLQEENIPFGSFDILSDEEVRQGLKKHSNWPTYPQLYVKGELVGGLDILKEMKEEGGGSLKEQLGIPAETIEDRLKKLTNRSRIMLFMKGLPSQPRCGFSRQMVEILDDVGVTYDAFDILQDEEVRQGLKTYSNWPTYPQLYVNGELIGGLDIVKELKEEGELSEALAAGNSG